MTLSFPSPAGHCRWGCGLCSRGQIHECRTFRQCQPCRCPSWNSGPSRSPGTMPGRHGPSLEKHLQGPRGPRMILAGSAPAPAPGRRMNARCRFCSCSHLPTLTKLFCTLPGSRRQKKRHRTVKPCGFLEKPCRSGWNPGILRGFPGSPRAGNLHSGSSGTRGWNCMVLWFRFPTGKTRSGPGYHAGFYRNHAGSGSRRRNPGIL